MSYGAQLLIAGSGPTGYFVLKWIHVLGIVIYAGGFLALTRLMGHAVRFESEESRRDAFRIFKRMHKFVDWGGLFLTVGAGLWLLVWNPLSKSYMGHESGYFHMKLTFVLILIVTDVIFSRRLFALTAEGEQPKAAFFRIIHGVSALMVLLTLLAVFVVRG